MVQGLRICLSVQEVQEIWIRSLGQEDALEKEIATHSSILACEIPQTEEPDGLQSMGVAKSQTQQHRHMLPKNIYVSKCMCTHTYVIFGRSC